MKRSILAGVAAGALAFAALNALSAQRYFTVEEVAADPGKFYGREVPVTGLVRSPRQTTRYVNRQNVPVVSFSLYSPGQGKTRWGDRYISVTVPAAQFRFLPNEGDPFNLSGVLKAPVMIGSIEP